MTDDEKHRQYKAYWREHCRISEQRNRLMAEHREREYRAWEENPFSRHRQPLPPPVLPDYPEKPEWLNSMTCGAKTRAGTPCKMTSLYGNGRCKLHGGMSTGPTSPEGKRKAASNGNAPKRKQTP